MGNKSCIALVPTSAPAQTYYRGVMSTSGNCEFFVDLLLWEELTLRPGRTVPVDTHVTMGRAHGCTTLKTSASTRLPPGVAAVAQLRPNERITVHVTWTKQPGQSDTLVLRKNTALSKIHHPRHWVFCVDLQIPDNNPWIAGLTADDNPVVVENALDAEIARLTRVMHKSTAMA
jgi:hypothetical protein